MTKNNRIRLRYFAGVFILASMVATGLLGHINSSVAYAPAKFSNADSYSDPNDNFLDEIPSDEEELVRAFVGGDFSGKSHKDGQGDRGSTQIVGDDVNKLHVFSVENAEGEQPELNLPREEKVKIGAGDTVGGTLQNMGISGADAYKAVKAMSKHYNPRDIRAGQMISVSLEPGEDGVQLGGLHMRLGVTEDVVVSRDGVGRYTAELHKKEIIRSLKANQAPIESSLYGSAARAGIPASVVANMIRVYSYEIDFQRDLRRGDKVRVLYETYETEEGDLARVGNVLYAGLTVGGRDIEVYRYDGKDGEYGYYRKDGKSLKRTLMSTPIDGARMSSGFGMRRHPVLGYNKMHKGVDFAASRGTPIYAAGDGVIEKASRYGAYGNYVRIKHNNSLKTAYAHMQKFAKGVKAGSRVKQGDVIGYVGTTGRSTGPHLHFEVLNNDRQVNPKSIKSMGGKNLEGQKLAEFKAQIEEISREYASLSNSMKFAKNETKEAKNENR